MDTATKTGIYAAKTASKRVLKKTIGNKIADKITSVGKSKSKEKGKKDETNEIEKIYVPPEKKIGNH